MLPSRTRFFDESQQRSFDRGRVAEKGADVIEVLEARGFVVSQTQRETILATTDLETLTRWIRQAVTIENADELFH